MRLPPAVADAPPRPRLIYRLTRQLPNGDTYAYASSPLSGVRRARTGAVSAAGRGAAGRQ